jgi:hypothetical protein
MESLLVTSEVIAVTLLTFILALVVQPLLVMAVLGLARRAAQCRPRAREPQSPAERGIAELRMLATGPKSSSQD